MQSLLAKPFTILTGASGTGKTKVAESLAKALTNEDGSNSAVVAVGSDWTDNRNVLGFVNHLREGKDGLPIYQSTPILDLLLEASAEENADLPYFLILDEMNLSHVERYFADFLSAMERSESVLALHQEGDESTHLQRFPEQEEGDVPQSLPYPQNLFVIGTVNIDETTYMFSPKVLDRANVIEFAVDSDDIGSFLAEPKDYEMAEKASAGLAEGFLALAKQARQLNDGLEGLPEGPKTKADAHLVALFKILKAHRYEYGYRTAAEVTKYLRVCRHLADDKAKWDAGGWRESLDEQIVQKLLPKLHGSVGRVGGLLARLGCYCFDGSQKEEARLDDLLNLKEGGEVLFPRSFAKLKSMAQTLRDEQFVSFIQ
ncbi:AAA family ATPase [Roseibacillus persicicus]|uniref:McrB family protein n=1 Tax=Roseibacillus persicicus TaxID=454148 RepID=UPI00398AFBAD